MKNLILAIAAVLTLGLGVANAATTGSHATANQGNTFNFLQGGD